MYITAIYFILTTATTVGYGDYYAHNPSENAFLIFVQIVGICFFSTVTGKISSLKKEKKIMDIVEEKVLLVNNC